jgi:DNA-binding response OmpR family regulator
MRLLTYHLPDLLMRHLARDFRMDDAKDVEDLHSLASLADEYGFDAFVVNGHTATGLRKYTQGVIVSLIPEDNPTARAIELERGADYALSHPYPEEVKAYIHAGSRDFKHHMLQAGCVTVNLAQKDARVHAKDVHLTKIEYAIVEMLALKQGGMITKQHMHDLIYGDPDTAPDVNTVDVFVCRLRKKGLPIHTGRGRGYSLPQQPCEECRAA